MRIYAHLHIAKRKRAFARLHRSIRRHDHPRRLAAAWRHLTTIRPRMSQRQQHLFAIRRELEGLHMFGQLFRLAFLRRPAAQCCAAIPEPPRRDNLREVHAPLQPSSHAGVHTRRQRHRHNALFDSVEIHLHRLRRGLRMRFFITAAFFALRRFVASLVVALVVAFLPLSPPSESSRRPSPAQSAMPYPPPASMRRYSKSPGRDRSSCRAHPTSRPHWCWSGSRDTSLRDRTPARANRPSHSSPASTVPNPPSTRKIACR